MKVIYFLTLLLSLSVLNSSLFAQKLTVFVDEFPPFNYTKNDKIEGLSTDVVRAVLDRTDFEYKIISVPWSRAYVMSQTTPNTLIFSILRINKREKLFKWIGIVAPAAYSVYALKNREDIKIKELDDLKKYQVGTVINDVHEHYFVSKKFDLNKFQRVAGKNAYVQNYRKLLKKRIDVLPMSDAVINFISKEEGDDPTKVLKRVYSLHEVSSEGAYIAASLTTDDEIIRKITKTLESFKGTQEYQEILKKWGL